MKGNLVSVRGSDLSDDGTHERSREKLARIMLDSMVQFVGLLDANGTVIDINRVALDAVGVKLADVVGKPFWTTAWWQGPDDTSATVREQIRRAAAGEFVRWDTSIHGRASGKETIIIDASLTPVKDDQGKVVLIVAEGRDITERKTHEREAEQNLEARVAERTAQLVAEVREREEAEGSFRLLVQGVVDYAIYMIDPHGVITNWN